MSSTNQKDYEFAAIEENIVPTINTDSIHSIKSHTGSTLTWTDIEYSVQVVNNNTNESEKVVTKSILHPMSGEAYPGELLAVMGTSGAGKSTLLDVLAGRLDSIQCKGTVRVNGNPIDLKSYRKETAYVMQSDALFPLLTVRETFRYAAYLRVTNKTVEEKNEIVESIINLLRLEKVADSIVGNEDNRGLSGGEKRRVSIGVDIVHFPAIIFLDEPTSGLDSNTALSVVDSLKILAKILNCTIVMTIHQPSTRLFNLIDKVLFLAMGKVTYRGPVSSLYSYTKQIYIEAQVGEAPIAANPPEIWLDLCDQLLEKDCLSLVTSKYTTQNDDQRDIKNNNSNIDGNAPHTIVAITYANTFINEFLILAHRALQNVLRTPQLFFARLGAAVFFGVQLGTLFLFTNDDAQGIQHRTSYFVFTIAFFYYTSLEALPIFLAEREIFQREYSRGAYRALSYTLANTIVTLPFLLTIATLFVCVTWWLVGLPNYPGPFFFQILIVFTVLVAGSSFATMFSVLVPNPMAGQTAGSGLFSVMFLFSGFFISGNDIPDYWIWLHYLSLFKYALDSMTVNAFENFVSYSDDTDGNIIETTNEDILRRYSVNGVNRGTGVGVLWLFIIFFRIVFCYRLTTVFNGSRK